MVGSALLFMVVAIRVPRWSAQHYCVHRATQGYTGLHRATGEDCVHRATVEYQMHEFAQHSLRVRWQDPPVDASPGPPVAAPPVEPFLLQVVGDATVVPAAQQPRTHLQAAACVWNSRILT